MFVTHLLTTDLRSEVKWTDVKRQLAIEDHSETEAGNTVEGNMTTSVFMVVALELEDAQ